ncbi:MAG: hypothetical protein J7513_18395 [Solirubrobacteraceae bacterium]|nr:hypothetical protein [Solirubrobacteraceae bacterium]
MTHAADDDCAPGMAERRVGLWARPGVGVFYAGVWLVYLVPAFFEAADGRHGLLEQMLGLAVLTAFVVTYLWWMILSWGGDRQIPATQVWPSPMTPARWWMAGGLVVLAVAAVLLVGEPGAATIVFLAPVAASALPMQRAMIGIGLAVVGVVAAEAFATRPPGDEVTSGGIAGTAFGCLMAGVITLGIRRMRSVMHELDIARARAQELATAEERVRIARDLHDLLGHSLTVISVRSQLAQRLAERGEMDRAAEEIGAVGELSRTAMTEVRAAVAGYRMRPLAAELAAAEAALDGAGIAVRVDRPSQAVPPAGEEALGFVVREGVTNVLRHARARSCAITVGHAGDAIVLEVADDGAGSGRTLHIIDPEAEPELAGNGLRGLAERVAAAGGRLSAGDRDGRFVLRAEVAA